MFRPNINEKKYLKLYKKAAAGISAYLLPIWLCIVILISSCRKDKNEGDIPYVTVNLSLSLSLPQYAPLNSVGNAIEISGGYKGIIVYHRFQNEFAAYERACSFDPLINAAIIEIDSNLVSATDRNCGSRFFLTDGSVQNGPAVRSLKQYQTEYDPGSQTLYIFN